MKTKKATEGWKWKAGSAEGVILSSRLEMKARPQPGRRCPLLSEQSCLPQGKPDPVSTGMTNGPSATTMQSQGPGWDSCRGSSSPTKAACAGGAGNQEPDHSLCRRAPWPWRGERYLKRRSISLLEGPHPAKASISARFNKSYWFQTGPEISF